MEIILHNEDSNFNSLSIDQSKFRNSIRDLINCENYDIRGLSSENCQKFSDQYIVMIVDRSPNNKELNLVASYMNGSNIFGKVIFIRWIDQYVGLTLNQVDELSEYLTNKRLLLKLADMTL